ncbi:MAG: NAD(P)H-dependent oxidoreductase subunit E [Nitrospirota bacterium]
MGTRGFSLKRASAALEGIYEKHQGVKGAVIPILQDIQEEFGYLPEEAVNWLADRLEMPKSTFFGVATFYSQFYLSPRGRNVITACSGTACHVKGSDSLINSIRRELQLGGDQDTTGDNEFTVEKVNCVGACSIAPVVIVNKKVHGKASSAKILKEIKTLKKKK